MNGRYGAAIGAEVRPPRYDAIRVLEAPSGPYRTVAEIAAERKTTPVDVMIDLSLERDFRSVLRAALREPRPGHRAQADRAPAARSSRISDSGAHVSQIIDASVPTHFLSHWVREEQAFTWEQGVRMLTADPARSVGLRRPRRRRRGLRGRPRRRSTPNASHPSSPTPRATSPAGALRLKQGATGIDATVVNGRVLLVDGEPTGDLPGRLLRGPLATR